MIRGELMTVNTNYWRSRRFADTGRRSSSVAWVPPVRYQQMALIASDAVAIGLAFILSSAIAIIGHRTGSALPQRELIATGFLAIIWLLALRTGGVYVTRHLRAGSDEYRRVINASLVAAALFGISCFLAKYDYSRLHFVLWIVLGVMALCIARFIRRRTMHRLHSNGLFQTPVLVAGADHNVDEVAIALRRATWTGYKIVGAVTSERLHHTSTGLPVLGTFEDIVDIITSKEIGTVIFAEGSFSCPSDFRRLAWKLEESQVQVMVVPNLAEVSSERLMFAPMAGLPLVDVARPGALGSLKWSKRAADIVGSSLLLLATLPLLLITAIAVKLEDGGPVIFRQARVGLKGERFNCLKFRSMGVDAEDRMADLLSKNEGAGVLFKMADDPRITRVGRIIRRFSIDELPQLWNTLQGDMSLVGPRPALPAEVERYDSDTRRRLKVRPGLTGLWQVSGRSNLSWEDTVRLDLYYVDNWSLVRDLMILARTAKAVLGSNGAY